MWAKGQSGNPGGRPAEPIEIRHVRRLAQEKTERAFLVIAEIMEQAESDGTRLAAALAMLKMAGMRLDSVTVESTKQAPQLPPNPSERESLRPMDPLQ